MSSHQPIYTQSQEIKTSYYTQKRLPLTTENLSNLNHELSNVSNEVMERYCQELSRASVREKPSIVPDVVLASPRLLPFPYHNDSHFLPTAEQLQYNLKINGSTYSSSSQTETASLLSTIPISRPHSTHAQKCHNNSAFSSASRTSPERRSLLTRIEYSNSFKPRVEYSNSLKPRNSNGCTRQTSFRSLSSSTIASSICKESNDKKPWLKRILNFLSKSKLNKKQPLNKEKFQQVWFRQYSENPTFVNKPIAALS